MIKDTRVTQQEKEFINMIKLNNEAIDNSLENEYHEFWCIFFDDLYGFSYDFRKKDFNKKVFLTLIMSR